jgi:hypothetical protein
VEPRYGEGQTPPQRGAPAAELDKLRQSNSERLESYRGIARRLQLPLDLLPAPPQPKQSAPAGGARGAGSGQSQAKPERLHATEDLVDDIDDGKLADQNLDKDFVESDPREKKNERELNKAAEAGAPQDSLGRSTKSQGITPAKGGKDGASLVRVLFVLRASPEPSAASAAPVPVEAAPVEPQPTQP